MRWCWIGLVLTGCDWVFEDTGTNVNAGDDTGASSITCGSLPAASSSYASVSSLTLDGTSYTADGGDDACVSADATSATWSLFVDGDYAGTLSVAAAPGTYAWPGNPASSLVVRLDGAAFDGSSWAGWASGNVQVSDDGSTVSVNISNLASSASPELTLRGSFTATR